jgi:hypothetical protein
MIRTSDFETFTAAPAPATLLSPTALQRLAAVRRAGGRNLAADEALTWTVEIGEALLQPGSTQELSVREVELLLPEPVEPPTIALSDNDLGPMLGPGHKGRIRTLARVLACPDRVAMELAADFALRLPKRPGYSQGNHWLRRCIGLHAAAFCAEAPCLAVCLKLGAERRKW